MKKLSSLFAFIIIAYFYGYSQPANDDCTNPTPISVPSSGSTCVTGTTVGATATTWGSAVCGQTTWTDVWYTFVSTGGYTVISVSPTGNPSAQQIGINVFTGTCTNATGFAGSCQISTTNNGSDTVIPTLPVGTQYYVEIASFGNAGSFELCINSTTPPNAPGSTCATATKLCTEAAFNLSSVPAGGSAFTPNCFTEQPLDGVWYQFTVGVTGQISWECTPTTPPSSPGAGDGIELDWAMYDITNGCPTNANQSSEVTCNFNYEGSNSDPIGMSPTSTTNCPTSASTFNAAKEFCPSATLTAGQTYAIFINNYSYPLATGWNFNFNGSTFQMIVDTFLASPDTICGNSGTVNITNNSGGAVWQQWNFGDGNTSTAVSPGSHSYANAGTYFISLTDSSQTGCVVVASQSVQITPNPTVTVANDTTCPGSSGTLTAVPSVPGGTYLWSTAGTGNSITVSPGGTTTYTVTYTSPTGCSASTTGTVVISNANGGSVTVANDTTCPGSSATLTAVPSIGGGTYLWSTGGTGNSITVSPGGTTTYTVTYTAPSGCSASTTGAVVISNNASASIVANPTAICAGQSSTLTASAATGYSWSPGGQTTSSITVTPASTTTYDVTVTMGGTCTASASATVVVNTPSASITPSPTSVCVGQGSLLTASPGVSYLWSNAATTDTTTVYPTANTTYDVTVTFGVNCSASASAAIGVNANPSVNITPAAVTICPGVDTSLLATGGVGYLWSTNATTASITVSPAITTTYTVTATNASTCTASSSAVVTVSPVFTVTPAITDIKCNNQTTGAITLTPNGTTGPYSYTWSDGNTGATISNLSAGTDTVTVSDNNQCSITASYTVTQPTALVLNAPTITNIGCSGGNTGAITANVSGGTPGYTYSWVEQSNHATYTGQTINNLAADNYGLSVSDANGCSAVAVYTVTQIPVLAFSPYSSNVTCAGYNNGIAGVVLTSGTPPFQYAWEGAGTPDDSIMTSIPPGAVSVVVTDANNCTGYAGFNITQPTEIYVEETSLTNVSCNGGSNGRISAFAYGGTGTLFPLWSNGPGGFTDSNLVAGNYTITVTDSNLCTATLTETINQPTGITITMDSLSARCYGGSDGYGWASAAGGTGPYSYDWSNGSSTDTAMFLSTNGSPYYCTVTDANQCTATASLSVGQPTQLYIDPTATAVKCAGQQNGTIAVADTGGTPPYTYAATRDGFNFIYATDSLIEGVDTGWYTVLVEDGNGCSQESQVYVPNATPDNFIVTTDSTLCYGPNYNDGAVMIEPTVIANAPYQFSIDNGEYQPTGSFWGMSAGDHTVMVINGNQCMDTIPVVVYQPLPVVAEVIPDTITVVPGQNTQVQVSYLNANNPSFSWTPAIGLSCIDCPDPVINTYAAGQYTVTVSMVNDSAICYGSTTLWVELASQPEVFVPDAFSPNGDGNNDVFQIYGNNIKTVNMRIFNRWGELVFETSDQYNGWDGTYKGQKQLPGVYVWEATITFLDNSQTQKDGTVTLVR